MSLKFPQLVALTGAIVLLYAAVKDISPAGLLKAILTGSPIPQGGNVGGTYDKDGNFHPTVPDYLGGPGNVKPYDPPPTGQHNPAYDGKPGGVQAAYTQPYTVVSV